MLFSIPLEGEWSFALDPESRGEAETWFKSALPDRISLPGSVDEAQKTPLSTSRTMAHLSRRHPYVGKAWYAKTFEVPEGVEDHFFHIALERPHGEVNIWIDGYKLGRDESLSTAVRMLAGNLAPGMHEIVMMIDNSRFEAVGDAIIRSSAQMEDVAHSKTDHTQTNWNGVVGFLRVEAARASIAAVVVHAPSRDVTVKVELDAFDPDIRFPRYWTETHVDELTLTFEIAGSDQAFTITEVVMVDSAFTAQTFNLHLPETAAMWDEFSPVVHHLSVEWRRDGIVQDLVETDFGVRSFVADGRRLRLNGRPVFLRGTLDCALFPLTGYPPTDHASWEKVFRTIQSYGLNHVRYHSWCPPEAAFEVADRLGLLLHIEAPIWAILGADPALDRYIRAEAERIVRDYGNHPSFVMLCVGNEVHGTGLHAFLERFLDEWKGKDTRRVYTGGSGWPTVKRADYISKPEPRSQRWGEGLDGRLNARALETQTDWSEWVNSVPMALISHEIGEWCAYPNLDEIEKYTGVLEARNLQMVKEELEENGLAHLARDFLMASGALQTQLYKEDIEAALRTSEMAGTQLLGLQDFSGQGTALVGAVDAFWDPKPYVTAAEFREFCAPMVPLVRAERFVIRLGETFTATAQLAQFGPEDIQSGQLSWALVNSNGEAVRAGKLDPIDLPSGDVHTVGQLAFDANGLDAPKRYELILALDGTEYRNRWGVWIMPQDVAHASLPLVKDLGDNEYERLAAGETLVLCPSPDRLRPNAILGHTTAFWNTLWTNGQAPHTLGLLIDAAHPIFDRFPTEKHSDWHWWELTHRRRSFDVQKLPHKAIVRVIDDWNTNRDLVLCAELTVGAGRLVLCSFDLNRSFVDRPVTSTFRAALSRYLQNEEKAGPEVTADVLQAWWNGTIA